MTAGMMSFCLVGAKRKSQKAGSALVVTKNSCCNATPQHATILKKSRSILERCGTKVLGQDSRRAHEC